MPFGSKTSFTTNAYIGKSNIPSNSTTNYNINDTKIKTPNQGQNQESGNGNGYTTTGANVTSNISNAGKLSY